MYVKNCVVVAACLLAFVCLGCAPSGPEIAGVEGVVTMDGEPLPDAMVVFIPESGRPAGASTDSQGRYELNFTEGRKGAMLGKNRVRISTAADPSETPDGQPIPGRPETVPSQYNSQSTLEFTVVAGKNTANFDLTSEGEIGEQDDMITSSIEDEKSEPQE